MPGYNGCPRCDVDMDGEHCAVTCDRPECGPCSHDRFRAANPIEAARQDAEALDDAAQSAEEHGHSDWRVSRAEASAAWAYLAELEEARDARKE